MQKKILEFTNILRKSGIRVSTAEAIDAFQALDELSKLLAKKEGEVRAAAPAAAAATGEAPSPAAVKKGVLH